MCGAGLTVQRQSSTTILGVAHTIEINQKEHLDILKTIQTHQQFISASMTSTLAASHTSIPANAVVHVGQSPASSVITSTSLTTASTVSYTTDASSYSAASSSKYLSIASRTMSRVVVSTDQGAQREFKIRHAPPCPGADAGAAPWTHANCGCDRAYGQFRYKTHRRIAPRAGTTLDSSYRLDADITTWDTPLGKFRFALTVQGRSLAGALSIPSVTLTRQSILPFDAPVFQLAAKGNVDGLCELFRCRLATPNDRTVDGRTPMIVSARRAAQGGVRTLTAIVCNQRIPL